jgi:hypothetical protein
MWRAPRVGVDGDGYESADTFRTCSYCGSIAPEDLLAAFRAGGVTLDGSDWKYGFPHKFYVRGIKNPIAGKQVQVGSRSVDDKREPIMGPASPELFAKFYTEHLEDQGYSAAARESLLRAVSLHSGIEFSADADGRVKYRAPYHGFQK